MTESSESAVNWTRVAFAGVYVALFLTIVGLDSEQMFYLSPTADSYNFHRFLWCVASSCLAFGFLAFRFRRHPKSPFPLYVTYYPFLLGVISALVFSFCHVSEATGGFVFYYLSFGLCSVLAYSADWFWLHLARVVEKMSERI